MRHALNRVLGGLALFASETIEHCPWFAIKRARSAAKSLVVSHVHCDFPSYVVECRSVKWDMTVADGDG